MENVHRMHVVLDDSQKKVFDKLQQRVSQKRGAWVSANSMVREAIAIWAKKEKVA